MMRSLICVTLAGVTVMLPRLERAAGQMPPDCQLQQPRKHGSASEQLPALIVTSWPPAAAADAASGLSDISGFVTGIAGGTGRESLKALLFLERSLGSWSLTGFRPVLPDGSFAFAVPGETSWSQARIYIVQAGVPVTPHAGGPLPASLDAMAVLAASYARNYVPHQLLVQQQGVEGISHVQGIGQQNVPTGQLGVGQHGGGPQHRRAHEAPSVPPPPPPEQQEVLPPKSPSWTPDPQAQRVRTPPPPSPPPVEAAPEAKDDCSQPQIPAYAPDDYRFHSIHGAEPSGQTVSGPGVQGQSPPQTASDASDGGQHEPAVAGLQAGTGEQPDDGAHLLAHSQPVAAANLPREDGSSGVKTAIVIGASAFGGLVALVAIAAAVGIVKRQRAHISEVLPSPTAASASAAQTKAAAPQRQHRL